MWKECFHLQSMCHHELSCFKYVHRFFLTMISNHIHFIYRVVRPIIEHLSKLTKKSTHLRVWLILLFNEILFLSYRRIHSHLGHIKWCKIEKDMRFQNKGPLKTKKNPKQTHGTLINKHMATCHRASNFYQIVSMSLVSKLDRCQILTTFHTKMFIKHKRP
jgi:hypothetical protein